MADATDQLDDIEAQRQARYEAARRSAEQIAASQRIDLAGAQPPGSPTQFLGRESQLLGPRATDEFNIPLPTPRGAVGMRGYPSAAEYAAASANDAATAKENQFNTDLNAVGSRYPTAPRFQMPSTDQLIDAGIQAKRDALQNEINTRKVHLGQLPPSAIGASATTLDSEQAPVTSIGRHGQRGYGASPASQTRAELAFLEHSAAGLDRAQAEVIRQNSHLALQNAKDNEVLSQDTARAQVVDFLGNIDDSRYPHGSDDRQKFIGKVFGSRPDWLHVMAKDPHLAKYVQDHVDAQDKVAQTMAQLKTLYPDLEVTPRSISGTGKVGYGVGVSAEDKAAAKEQSKLEARLHSQTGLTPEEFASVHPDNVKAGGIWVPRPTPTDANAGTFHESTSGFNTNGSPKGEFSNDTTHILGSIVGGVYKPGTTAITPKQQADAEAQIKSSGAIQIDTGKGYKSVIPRVDYERYRDAFKKGRPATAGKVLSVDDWLNQ